MELLFEFFYSLFDKIFSHSGLAIVGVSFAVSLLVLPLYQISERVQKKERCTRVALQPGIQRIKSTFKSDEQYMILSAFYRQKGYHPLYALRGSLSLLIQVPFFIAAYHFLSNLSVLDGQSFLFITDLGQPDHLIPIGPYRVNILPILMTAINIVSGAIYTKGFPLRDKIQLYGIAGLFLILLYQSPAALVLYWTLNNLFSLAKNILYRLKHPAMIVYVLASVAVVGLSVMIWSRYQSMSLAKRVIIIGGCIGVLTLPVIIRILKGAYSLFLARFGQQTKSVKTLFVLSALALFLLQGVVIPANLISSSVIEFSNSGLVGNPLSYVLNTAVVFFGIWIVWGSLIFYLAPPPGRAVLAWVSSSAVIASLFNVFVFKGDYGIVNSWLQFEAPELLIPSLLMIVIPVLVTIVIFAITAVVFKKSRHSIIESLLVIVMAGTLVSGIIQCRTIFKEYTVHQKNLLQLGDSGTNGNTLAPVFFFSRSGKNVLYLFLDMAANSFFPYVIEEVPELKNQLRGFVYYPNVVSFGSNTIYGTPAMSGGYEYTPDAMNARKDEKLVDKHNEALLVFPRLFLEHGYQVTLVDPPWSNYIWAGDFSPYHEYPEMNVFSHHGKFAARYKREHSDVLDFDPASESQLIKKRFPIFSIMKSSLPLVREFLYGKGNYYQVTLLSAATERFIEEYSQLYYLPELTGFVDDGDVYLNITNDTPHRGALLQTPDFVPQKELTHIASVIDSIEGIRDTDRWFYHANVAALKQIGLWFDFLRAEGVYDNTRIVIVSDHANLLYSEGMKEFGENRYAYNRFVPLLMMKDFNQTDSFSWDYTFMTNADAPLSTIEDIIDTPVNPFTNKNLFEQMQKESVNIYNGPWNPQDNRGNLFRPDLYQSFNVRDDIFVESNWTPLAQ